MKNEPRRPIWKFVSSGEIKTFFGTVGLGMRVIDCRTLRARVYVLLDVMSEDEDIYMDHVHVVPDDPDIIKNMQVGYRIKFKANGKKYTRKDRSKDYGLVIREVIDVLPDTRGF